MLQITSSKWLRTLSEASWEIQEQDKKLRSCNVTPGWSALLNQANQAAILRNWTSGVVQSQYLSFFVQGRSQPSSPHAASPRLHVPELLPSNMNSPWDQEHTQPPGHQGCTPTTRMGSNRAEPQNRGYLFRLYHQVLNKAILTFFHILNTPRIWKVHFKGGEKYLSPNFCHSKIHRKY